MDVLSIDRVMVAAPDVNETVEQLGTTLDIDFDDEPSVLDGEGITLNYGHPGIEVVSPGAEDDAIAGYLERHGPGLYGLVLRVADLAEAKAELAEKDIEPIREGGSEAAPEAFYHPKHFGGVLTVLTEYEHPGFADH